MTLASDGTLSGSLAPNVDAQYQGGGLYKVTPNLKLKDGSAVGLLPFSMRLVEGGGPYDLSDFMTEFGALPPVVTDNGDGTFTSSGLTDNGDGTFSG